MVETSNSSRGFEGFNARFLTSEEVAKTFIPPPQYAQLVEIGHTILLGPRGSGKTTLLKMLQLRSLAAWEGEYAAQVRREIGYHSIFLGTDVLWGSQLAARTDGIRNSEKRSQIHRTSFRLHMALAFLNSLDEIDDPILAEHPDLQRFTQKFSRETEHQLMRGLASIWLMNPHIDSRLGIRIGIRTQLAEILAITNRLRRDDSAQLPPFADIDPVASIISAIDLTNVVLKQPRKRWAILCDELEIAPEMIRNELFQFMRSTSDHNIIFKFSLFPYSRELSGRLDPDSPSSDNDYRPLELYYGHRNDAYEFCEAMLQGMLAEYGAPPTEKPTDVLKEGWFDGGRSSHRRERISPYHPTTGKFIRRARELLRFDTSFATWLKKTGFDLSTVHSLSDAAQAPFRKALPYILTRSEFLNADGGMRSRKSYSLYSGAYSLFSLTEGNPRVFINLMRPLVKEYARTRGTVSVTAQTQSAELTVHRFLAGLSAIPTLGHGEIHSILQLIKIIGSYFCNSQLGSEFKPEPASAFKIDDDINDDLLDLVGRALNAGAFIFMPEDGNLGLRELRGARLRLAYTLAPEFKLALTANSVINLSTILRNQKDPLSISQARLPFDTESSL
jgi:hypothetical protein